MTTRPKYAQWSHSSRAESGPVFLRRVKSRAQRAWVDMDPPGPAGDLALALLINDLSRRRRRDRRLRNGVDGDMTTFTYQRRQVATEPSQQFPGIGGSTDIPVRSRVRREDPLVGPGRDTRCLMIIRSRTAKARCVRYSAH
jgi:hypothetical protein